MSSSGAKRYLLVGDPHARPEDLEDCDRLRQLIVKTVHEKPNALGKWVDAIVFLGDQFHTHAILHLEALHWWRRTLQSLTKLAPVVLLAGNHDQPGDSSSSANALEAFKDMPGVTVVDVPNVIDDILFMPYCHDTLEFVDECKNYPTKTVICHQTFNGARYENGFYAPGGVDAEEIPQQQVISGHIHDPQAFGKVEYLGASRWLTASDANADRFLTLVEQQPDDTLKTVEKIPVDTHCSRIHHLVDTPEKPIDPETMVAKDRYLVDIEGPADWIAARRPLFSGKARLKTRRTDKPVVKVRESEGIEAALDRYLASYNSQHGTNRQSIKELVNARVFGR